MNENFTSVMYPPMFSKATHFVLEKTFFYDASEDNIPPIGKRPKQYLNNPINKGEQVTLIEYGIGYKGQYSKVKYKDSYIFIETSFLSEEQELTTTYSGVKGIPGPLYPFNASKEYLPDYSSNKIIWREQAPNIVYEDKYTAKLCVHVELPEVTEVINDDDLKNHIQTACYLGTDLILKSKGIKISNELLTRLVDNFYIFSRAEEYYFPLRKCSTLRVLVTLPTRFFYSSANILLSDEWGNSLDDSDPNSDLPTIIGNDSLANNPDSIPPENNDIELVYKTKEDLDTHFSTIAGELIKIFSLFTIPPSKTWIIEPKTTPDVIPVLGAVDLLKHQQKIGDLHKDINEFIYQNLLEQSKLHTQGLENYKKVFKVDKVSKNDTNYWFSITDLLTLKKSVSSNYEGKLYLQIDKVNLVLKDIKFYTIDDEEIPLNVGRDKFFSQESVKNKTSLNYLCKISPYTTLADKYISWKEENNTDLLKINNIDKLVKSIIDELFSAKSSVNESEIKTFLINNHYPTITSVSSTKLPLNFSCADIVNAGATLQQRIQAIRISESPAEKLRAYNKLVFDAQNISLNEGGLFGKYLLDPSKITNPNFKILLGLEGLSPEQEVAINQFISAASTVDWPRFLQDSVSCFGVKFDPTQFTNLINEFERARQLLETCNPSFSIDILNQLSDFALPELPDFNPNLSLIEDLKNVVLKIINEAMVFVIRKLIEDALKACVSAMAEKGGNEHPASAMAPDENRPAPNLDNVKNRDELDSLLKDTFGIDNAVSDEKLNENNLNQDNNLDNAKELIKNLLNDIIPCLSLREMCDILSGKTVNDEVYDFISSLINKKYNSKSGNTNLALKLNSKKELVNFFKKLGAAFNLNFCSDLLDDLENTGKIPNKPLCDDGSRKARQKAILEDKGLSDEQIDNLLNDLQKADEQSLRDVLNFLNNKDSPFDLNNIPTVLCQKGPNGEIIPPAVSMAPPMKMFGKVLDSVFKPVYDNFDSEAVEWYKNTYTSVSSASKDNIKLENGKIVAKADKSKTPTDEEKRSSAKEKMLLNNLFNVSSKNVKFENGKYTINIDGYKEQELETLIADEVTRKDVISENVELYNFLDRTFTKYETKLDNNPSEKLKTLSQDISVQQFFSLGSSFYCSNIAVINNEEKIKRLNKLFGFSNNNIANSLFAESLSIPLRDSLVSLLDKQTVKDFLSEIGESAYAKKTFQPKQYQMVLSALNSYSNYDVSLDIKDSLESGIIRNDYELQITKNGIEYINISDFRELDSDILTYLKTIGADNINSLSKEDIFNKFIQNKRQQFGAVYLSESVGKIKEQPLVLTGTFKAEEFKSENIGTANFKSFSEWTIKEMVDVLAESPFSKVVSIPISIEGSGEFKDPGEAFIKPPNFSDPKQKPTINAPLTQYMSLVIPQTSVQKACNIRPHYLEIDSIKEDLFKNKEEAFCVEEIKNKNILNSEEVDMQDLAEEEPTDTQSIMLEGGYSLLLRVYLHDLLLRAISIFGIFDPQSLRNDDIFHTFLLEMIEAEMRSRDNTAFNMMMAFYDRNGIKLKDVIVKELKTSVLPKMAKRINEDTNDKLASLTPPQKINLRTVHDIDNTKSKLIKIDPQTKSIYIRVNGTKIVETSLTNEKKVILVSDYKNKLLKPFTKYEELIFYQKIFESNSSDRAEILRQFKSSPEYKVLYDFLIPKKEMLTFLFITNVLANTSSKKRRDSFEMTKSNLQNSIKFMATSGAAIKPNPNNYQDMKNADTSNMFIKFILQAIISAPISIVKGYTELTEPNIALSSKLYLLAKSFVPETPSAMIPAISLPLGIPIPPAFPLGIVPWVNIPLALFYLISGIWMDFGNNQTDKENKTSKDLLNKLSKGLSEQNAEKVNCDTVFNPDVVRMVQDTDGDMIYDISKPSPIFNQADTVSNQQAVNEQEIIKQYQIKQILKNINTDSLQTLIGINLPNLPLTGDILKNKMKDEARKVLIKLDYDDVETIFNSKTPELEKTISDYYKAYFAPAKQLEQKKEINKNIKDLVKDGSIKPPVGNLIKDNIKTDKVLEKINKFIDLPKEQTVVNQNIVQTKIDIKPTNNIATNILNEKKAGVLAKVGIVTESEQQTSKAPTKKVEIQEKDIVNKGPSPSKKPVPRKKL
jgi:hypothetical protein